MAAVGLLIWFCIHSGYEEDVREKDQGVMTLNKRSFLMSCVLSCILHTVSRCAYDACLCNLSET